MGWLFCVLRGLAGLYLGRGDDHPTGRRHRRVRGGLSCGGRLRFRRRAPSGPNAPRLDAHGRLGLRLGAGEVVWSYYELLVGQQVPFPSFADLGYLLAVPLAIAGVLYFPSAPSKATSRARTILDGLLITGSLLVISWSTVLGAVYRSGSGDLTAPLIGLAYPAGDVVIGTMLVILAARPPRSTRLPLYLLGGGLLANLLGAAVFPTFPPPARSAPGA